MRTKSKPKINATLHSRGCSKLLTNRGARWQANCNFDTQKPHQGDQVNAVGPFPVHVLRVFGSLFDLPKETRAI